MGIVTGGYGQPEEGGLVTGGYGLSEPAPPGAISANLTGTGTVAQLAAILAAYGLIKTGA